MKTPGIALKDPGNTGVDPLVIHERCDYTRGYGFLSTTELLVESAPNWVYTGELPSPRSGLCGTNIDNKVLMTGQGMVHLIRLPPFMDYFGLFRRQIKLTNP